MHESQTGIEIMIKDSLLTNVSTCPTSQLVDIETLKKIRSTLFRIINFTFYCLSRVSKIRLVNYPLPRN